MTQPSVVSELEEVQLLIASVSSQSALERTSEDALKTACGHRGVEAFWIVSVLGPFFSARRRVDLFFITRVAALLTILLVRVPLAAIASTRLLLRVLLLLSVGH